MRGEMPTDKARLAELDLSPEACRERHIRLSKAMAQLSGNAYTTEEKRWIRRLHADANNRALRALESPEGMARFLVTRELNPQLTPLAAARVAMDRPGCVVNTFRGWSKAGHRIRKDSHAISYGTQAPHMWPDPLFAAEQTDYPGEYVDLQLEEVGEPSGSIVDAAVESLRGFYGELGRKTKALNAWNEVAI